MPPHNPTPSEVVSSFIECINRGDVDGLGALMTPDHELRVFDEDPVQGREANVAAWLGYVQTFPAYIIHPHSIAVRDHWVAVLGHTTGSHLGMPDEQERALTLIWVADVDGAEVRSWQLVEDTPERRRELGLDALT